MTVPVPASDIAEGPTFLVPLGLMEVVPARVGSTGICHPGSAYPSLVTTATERKRLLREIDGYLDAAKNTREALLEVEDRLRRMKKLANEGVEVRSLVSSFPDPSTSAANLAESLKSLQVAQRRTRRQIVLMGRAEGLSLAQLAGFWGVPRQLISRYAIDSADQDS